MSDQRPTALQPFRPLPSVGTAFSLLSPSRRLRRSIRPLPAACCFLHRSSCFSVASVAFQRPFYHSFSVICMFFSCALAPLSIEFGRAIWPMNCLFALLSVAIGLPVYSAPPPLCKYKQIYNINQIFDHISYLYSRSQEGLFPCDRLVISLAYGLYGAGIDLIMLFFCR